MSVSKAHASIPRLAYSVAESADALGVCRQHVYDLIERGVIRSVKLGGTTHRISAAELARVLEGDGI